MLGAMVSNGANQKAMVEILLPEIVMVWMTNAFL